MPSGCSVSGRRVGLRGQLRCSEALVDLVGQWNAGGRSSGWSMRIRAGQSQPARMADARRSRQ